MILVQNIRQDSGMGWENENTQAVSQDFHFCLVTYGKCVYWIEGKKVVLEKGDALLIPSGSSFYWKSVPTVVHSKVVVMFKLLDHPPLLPVLGTRKAIHAKLGCHDWAYEKLKALGIEWADKEPYCEILASAMLVEVLTRWNRELDLGAISAEKHRNVDLMKKYMQDHYRNKVTKDDLAEVIRKSPNYAATLFRTVTGQTISEYVHAWRTRTAIYMLCESQLTVAEISDFLGYSDVSYFHKVFKRITGKSPSDYFSERPSRQI